MRSFFAGLLYVCFGLPLALSALMLISVRPWALDRDFYKRLVTDDALYTAIKAADPGQGKGQASELALGGSRFDRRALAAAVQKNLPVAELKDLGSRGVDAALDAAEGKRNPSTVDLRDLKRALQRLSPSIARDYAGLLGSRKEQPAPGDLSFRGEAGSAQALAELADKALKTAVASLPDAQAIPTPVDGRGRLAALSQAGLDRAAWLSATMAALLLGGLAWIGGRSAGPRLAKAGRFLLLPSIVVLALGFMLFLPGASILGLLVPAKLHVILGGGTQALLAYAGKVLGLVSRGFMLTGLVGASVGGALVSLRRALDPREL